MNELIKVNYDSDRPTILGRDLHEFLEVESNYTTWFKRMCEYDFIENIDFIPFLEESTGGRPSQDHQLTIDMAKEICMLQRSEKGKIARQYFIQLEKAWNTPEMIMSRALKMAERQMKKLQIDNARLTVDNQIMKPKADYFDELVDRGLNTGIRETAKELHIKECMNDKTEWKGLQLLITPKGKETFKLLYLAAM